MKFAIMMTLRYLRSEKSDKVISVISGLSFLGIALGVAALIIVMSVLNGFHSQLLNSILGFNGHISIFSYSDKGIANYEDIKKKIVKNCPQVISVDPLIEKQAIVTSNNNAIGTLIQAVQPTYFNNHKLLAKNIIAGNLDDLKNNSILIGNKMAMKLGARIGDSVNIITHQKRATVFGNIPQLRNFKIVAIFKVGMKDFDSNVLFMPLVKAQELFNYNKTINTLELFNQEASKTHYTTKKLRRLLPYLRIIDWQQANSSFFQTLKTERVAMFIVISLIILVASFNIVLSLIMFIQEKRSNIAILRTMGASKAIIYKIFIFLGLVIGASGAVIGGLVGTLLSYNLDNIRKLLEKLFNINLFNDEVYFLSHLPVEIDIANIINIVLFAIVLSTIFAFLPAAKAANIEPAEVLRH